MLVEPTDNRYSQGVQAALQNKVSFWRNTAIIALAGLFGAVAVSLMLGLSLFARARDGDQFFKAEEDEPLDLRAKRDLLQEEPMTPDVPVAPGEPVRIEMLAGLASCELRQPPWKETTFDGKQIDHRFLEAAYFTHSSNRAWVTVRVREATGPESAELEDLAQEFCSGITDIKTTRTTDFSLPCLRATGTWERINRVYRSTVKIVDGLVVHLFLECTEDMSEQTELDWTLLLKSFQFSSDGLGDRVYPVRNKQSDAPADTNLAVVLSKARRLLPAGPTGRIVIAPGGKQALRHLADNQPFIEDLTSHDRHKLDIEGYQVARQPSWNTDGSCMAMATEQDVVLVDPEGQVRKHIGIKAVELALSPDRLLACVSRAGTPAGAGTGNQLHEVHLTSGKHRTLVDLPAGWLAHPALAPDGKRIALVIDRDPDNPGAGHIFLCASDGTQLVQLTRQPEHVHSLAWSPDGKWLYAVRKLVAEEKLAGYWGDQGDLYRISPQTGEGVNLTRCERIANAWLAGPKVVLETMNWGIAESQRGVFEIGLAELEAATANRPAPPPLPPAERIRKLKAAVEAAAGKPIKQFVPTSANLAKVAEAFARAAEETSPHRFDFSAESLDRLQAATYELQQAFGREPAFVLGVGAYYGETLRRCAGAEWQIEPLAWGDWQPALDQQTNPLLQVVLPFSQPYCQALGSEDSFMLSRDGLGRRDQHKLLLVYPPAFAAEAMKRALPAGYKKAEKLLKEGKVAEALPLLSTELLQRPKNQALTLKVIELHDRAGNSEEGNRVAALALAAGCRSPELHIRLGDAWARSLPREALHHYRQAIEQSWPRADLFIKIGKICATQGRHELAQACWRRALTLGANKDQVQEIRSLLGLDKAETP